MHYTRSTQLIKLGLTTNEARCYVALLESGALSAAQIAEILNVLPNAVYRLLVKLETYGMIVALGGSPKKYQALPAEAAIEAFARHQNAILEAAKIGALGALSGLKSASQTKIGYIVGREDFFRTFDALAAGAESEVLVISIGEPVPDETKLVIRDALARQVACKFIFHKYDDENRSLLQAWSAMGVQVAHYPDSGFHLFVVDGKKAVLVGSNPSDTTERTGMIISGESLASAMREFFYARLEKSVVINSR